MRGLVEGKDTGKVKYTIRSLVWSRQIKGLLGRRVQEGGLFEG